MKPKAIEELEAVLVGKGELYGRKFSTSELERFCRYYELALKWNPLLHLTTITSPQEFAERHLLESAFAAQYIASNIEQLWDIGSGMGIPGIPLAILYPDILVTLIEANQKKCVFLNESKDILNIPNLRVINTRFEKLKPLAVSSCLTSRALEQLRRLLPNLFNLGRSSAQILLFGNNDLLKMAQMYASQSQKIHSYSIPNSNSRILISLIRST